MTRASLIYRTKLENKPEQKNWNDAKTKTKLKNKNRRDRSNDDSTYCLESVESVP